MTRCPEQSIVCECCEQECIHISDEQIQEIIAGKEISVVCPKCGARTDIHAIESDDLTAIVKYVYDKDGNFVASCCGFPIVVGDD